MNTQILTGDCRETLKTLPDQSVHCCVTSPPYFGLRDYGNESQIGLEQTPEDYVNQLVAVFREVKRVLRDDGTLWLNLGDSYNGSGKAGNNPEYASRHTAFGKKLDSGYHGKPVKIKGLKPKDLIGIPWRVAFALQADGWYLRQDIIWHKPNPMPESVTDRCTKAHEYIFLLSKSARYHYDGEAIMEQAVSDHPAGNKTHKYVGTGDEKHATKEGLINLAGKEWERRNRRSVWSVNTSPYKGAHFATFPPDLIEPCILAGCPKDGTVLDPFGGSGTTAQVAIQNNRSAILCELNPEYIPLINKRLSEVQPKLF